MFSTMMLGLALSLSAPAPKEAPKKEAPPSIDGVWVVEKFEGPGPKEVAPGSVTFAFKDGTIDISEGGVGKKGESAQFTIDYKKTPIEIDISPSRGGQGPDKKVLGIVKFEKEKMTLCFSKDGGTRPTEFTGDKGAVCIIFNKQKPEEKKPEEKK
jgi:uncharacterized protein (TIGR03067 family)